MLLSSAQLQDPVDTGSWASWARYVRHPRPDAILGDRISAQREPA